MNHSHSLPQFSKIDIAAFPQQLDTLLQENLKVVDELLESGKVYTWENLMAPLEAMDDKLEKFWAPFSHLHSVANSDVLRESYQACLPKLSAYESSIGHNHTLYEAIKSLNMYELNIIERKIVEDGLKDFKLSGVSLPKEQKQRFEAIQARLSALGNQFENNILDATHAFKIHVTDEKRLAGLPDHAINSAKERAEQNEVDGWLFNLEYPCFSAIITYAEDRELRQSIYEAYVTRSSDVGPNAGEFDNTSVMDEILALRQEKAEMLGFDSYADLSLATKMADSPNKVLDFLDDLNSRSHLQASYEYKRLVDFGSTHHGLDHLEPWDIAYISEKKCKALYHVSQEDLRPYFPVNKVMAGLFEIVHRLYGITIEEIEGVDTWHNDVCCYQLSDSEGAVRGCIYSDLFSRPHKRGGAWMDGMQTRVLLDDGAIQRPVATLTCNFAAPSGNKPATLSHDEVVTLFHEFGHCLHHVLTRVDYYSVSGIHGVEWDAVELPSQFFENWCWEQTSLELLSGHVDTNQTLPIDLYEKLIASKNFQSAMAMVRQLEFALFDFRIHYEYQAGIDDFIAKKLTEVRNTTTVVPIAPWNRFQHSFSHIFGGGYAAGYYSYKWAEVLSSDAYARFEDEGIFNIHTGRDFLHFILEVGGSVKAADAYRGFRGRDAHIDALLHHNGIR